MQLSDFESAWKQMKVLNAMHEVRAGEILLIIEGVDKAEKTTLQRVLFSIVVFTVITIFCQGG